MGTSTNNRTALATSVDQPNNLKNKAVVGPAYYGATKQKTLPKCFLFISNFG